MRNNLNINNFYLFLEVFIMNEEMIMNEETTAIVEVEDAEIAELAKVNGVEVNGEVVATEDGGINPVVAGAIGLGVTGVVGGLTYLFLKRKKNKKAKNDKVETKSEVKTATPETEAELNEYLEKLLAETKAVNDKIMELKKKTEKNEEDSEEE